MKVAVIGLGKVGSTIAYSLLCGLKELKELALVDIVEPLLEGERLDLGHAAMLLNPALKVSASKSYAVTKGSEFIVVTAGRARTNEATRDELAEFNSKIIRLVCVEIKQYAPQATVLVLTNPSSKMAELASSMLDNKVIAMDNQLDTARLRYYVREVTGVVGNSRVFGEHGEDMKFEITAGLTAEQKADVMEKTRGTGAKLVGLKGYTNWGIAAAVLNEIKNQGRV